MKKSGDEHWTRRNPAKVARGERSGKAFLTDEKVRAIRSMADTPQVLLAHMFGISQPTISRILTGKSWSHIQ